MVAGDHAHHRRVALRLPSRGPDLRLVDGPREVVPGFASRRALYELALLGAEVLEFEGNVSSRRLS